SLFQVLFCLAAGQPRRLCQKLIQAHLFHRVLLFSSRSFPRRLPVDVRFLFILSRSSFPRLLSSDICLFFVPFRRLLLSPSRRDLIFHDAPAAFPPSERKSFHTDQDPSVFSVSLNGLAPQIFLHTNVISRQRETVGIFFRTERHGKCLPRLKTFLLTIPQIQTGAYHPKPSHIRAMFRKKKKPLLQP